MMDRFGVDDEIKQAKTNAYTNAFKQAFNNGQIESASSALANLVETNPQVASAYMSMFPQYKDIFNINVARENAAQAQKFKTQNAEQAQKFALQKAELEAKVKASYEASQRSAKAAEEHNRRIMKYQSLQGMVDSGAMTEAERVAYAFGDYKPSKTSGKTDTEGNPMSKGDAELHQSFVNKWNDAWAKAIGTDTELSGQALDDLQNYLKEQYDKGKINQAYYEQMMSKISAGLGVRAKNVGNEDEAAEYFKNVSDDDWRTFLNPRGLWKNS